jgi:hypothetical protein
MGFNKKYYNKEGIRKVALTVDVNQFIEYFNSDGHMFEDEFSNEIYLKLLEIYKLKNREYKLKEIEKLIYQINEKTNG